MVPQDGYWGKILRVDLSTKKKVIETFDEAFARRYLGGVGFASRILFDEVTAHTDPLSPENRLVIGVGPFQGTYIAGSGRWAFCSRSPLSGLWVDSNGGGEAGRELKLAGFDSVVVQGKAHKPVYLWVRDENVEIRDAMHLWGKDTFETTDVIKEELDDSKTKIAAIGQAGENLVKYACVVNEKHGVNGRYGTGTVMGSKNLKAIAIRGTKETPIADPDRLKEIYRKVLAKVKEAEFTETNRKYGMPNAVVPREENSLLSMRNWARDRWTKGAKKLGTPRYNEVLKVKPWPCATCIMGCHRRVTAEGYPTEGSGPEYETLAMIGSNLLIDDLKAVTEANDLCNRYGIDTIELGGVLGLVFECYEKGLITKEDTDGIELMWGNAEALLELTKKVAMRDGFGSILAEGIRAIIEKIGPKAKPYAIEVKGGAVAAHDPRAFFSMAVETVTSTRGACHIRGFPEAAELDVLLPEAGINRKVDRFEWKRKGYITAKYQDLMQIYNSLVWCFFYQFSDVALTDLVDMLNAITGWNMTPKEALITGERLTNLQQTFNLRMGMIPARDDRLPKRLLAPHKRGDAAGKVPPIDVMLGDYYKARDWVEGIPARRKLIKLTLKDAAEQLYGY